MWVYSIGFRLSVIFFVYCFPTVEHYLFKLKSTVLDEKGSRSTMYGLWFVLGPKPMLNSWLLL